MIPVNEPLISKNASKYVLDCLKTGWISSAGKYIDKFEEAFAKYIGVRYAVTTTSGTTALHLALASIGIKPGDEVILPDLTIISCALAVTYLGATPVLVDVDKETGNIDPEKIEEKITKKTKAIIVVHLYGHPAQMDKILKIANKHSLLVVEDAAEAHGAEIRMSGKNKKDLFWKKVGSIGDVGCFSFYANKLITTGEGGMLVTNNQKIYRKAKRLKDLAHSPARRFYHQEIGYNFRMTNIQAALGLAQLEQAETYVIKKRTIAYMYTKGLSGVSCLELPTEMPWTKNVFWMYAPRIKRGSQVTKKQLCDLLKKNGIETRDYFVPLHRQPALRNLGLFKNEKYPVSDDLSNRGFYIPSGLALIDSQIKYVINTIKKIAK